MSNPIFQYPPLYRSSTQFYICPEPKLRHACRKNLQPLRAVLPQTDLCVSSDAATTLSRETAASGRQNLYASRNNETRAHRGGAIATLGIIFANVAHMRGCMQSETSYSVMRLMAVFIVTVLRLVWRDRALVASLHHAIGFTHVQLSQTIVAAQPVPVCIVLLPAGDGGE